MTKMMFDLENLLKKMLKTERKIELTLETREDGILIEWTDQENQETNQKAQEKHSSSGDSGSQS